MTVYRIAKKEYIKLAIPHLNLIFDCADKAVECAVNGLSGVIGWDEDNNNVLSCIEFPRIKGGKEFDTKNLWYQKMIKEINSI